MPTLALLLLTADLSACADPAFSQAMRDGSVAATVRIVNKTKGGDGSGTIIKQHGPFVYVLTANHVVEGGDAFEIAAFSVKSHPRPAEVYRSATVLARSASADLAILRLTAGGAVPGIARVCPPRLVPPAGKAFGALSVGCGGGHAPTCQEEKVLTKRRIRKPGERTSAGYWEVETPQAKGRSGGPLLDRGGFVIGVASGAGDGKGYYSHTEEIHAFLRLNGLKWLYE